MKKRLLSAALALAMVLTMLPLSVMPAAAATEQPTANTGVTQIAWNAPTTSMNLTYYNTGAQLQGHTIKSPGWYAVASSTAGGTTTYNGYVVYKEGGTGVITGINGGTWYPNLDAAITAKANNLVLLGNQTSNASLDPNTVSSLTIDLNGNTLGGSFAIPAKYTPATSGATAQNNSFSQLTIKDSTKSGSDYNGGSSAAITVGNGEAKATNTTITLNNVKVGNIIANYTTGCTVNVYGSETGDITLNGTQGGAVNVGNGTTKGKTGDVSVTTTGTAQGGTVTAYDATMGSVALSGVGASLTGTNANVGAVTLFGLAKVDNDTQKSTLNTPSVTLNGGKADSIGKGSGTELLTKPYTVTLNVNAQVNGVTLDNANVTVNNSAAGAITVKNGDVKLNGSATGPASAGNITLGGATSEASLTVTGTNVRTGNISSNGGTVKVTVPESDANSFGTLGSGITNRGISGGVWSGPVPADNLNTNLRYQATNSGKYRYYSDSQFQRVVDAYQIAHDTVITLVKDNATTKDNTITFKDGNQVLAILTYGTPNLPFVLPSSVNGRTVLKWSEYVDNGGAGDLLSEPTPGTTYSTPTALGDRILNAQASDNAITKLTNVTSNVNGITARLNGNVITLSGAIPSNDTTIEIKVTTDGNPPSEEKIIILYDNGRVTFGNQNKDLPAAMSVSNDYTTLIIGNGSASYTLNGSGLRVQADGLTGKIHGYTESNLPVIVTVNCSGTGWTAVRKAELAGFMSNDYDTIGTLNKTDKAKVSFARSTAVKEALNAAVAGITQSQIESWILNAQNTAWRKNSTTTPNASDRASTGYAEVHVVAYMAVNITNYNTANTPGTLTMTLTPSYYVEVTGTGGVKVTGTYALDPAKANELNALRPVNNRSLGSLTGEVGVIELTLNPENTFATNENTYAHQGGTYGYKNEVNTANTLNFKITHAINGALGQFIVDGQASLVTLYESKQSNAAVRGYYDTLQAAVDDAKNGEHINVDANYKGSCNITVTGTARTFTINTNGANKVTSNVSGVVTELASGSEYQVQLERDNVVNTTTVSVSSAIGGTMTANATSTRPGQTVTLTAVPSTGYQVGTPAVRTNTGASVPVSTVSLNTFSFVVPSGATSVTVTPSFVLNTGLPFTDVAAGAWYYEGVKYCYETMKGGNRLMQGFNNTTFGVSRPFTRAEVVTILWNMKGRPNPGAATRAYSDVGTSHWAYSAIIWATNNGYADGYSNGDGRPNGVFRPDQNVSRQEMVVFLWKAAGRPSGYSALSLGSYNDGYRVSDWAQNAMKWALAYGVLSGQSSVGLNGTLAPLSTAYRSEVAVTVMNFDKLKVF